jgi:ubiquinone/menaquinone biosynthesis C-methylase UbiE
MIQPSNYFLNLAGSYIRNILHQENVSDIEAINIANTQNIPYLYRFKKHSLIPRIKKIIDIVVDLAPNTILDVASQRGALLFPLLDRCNQYQIDCHITSTDIDNSILDFLKSTSTDITNLNVVNADVTNLPFLDDSYECVICSEILEHLKSPMLAAKEMIRVSTNFIICSVPALPDNNTEHIQLFYDIKQHDKQIITRDIQYNQTNLKQLWLDAGASSCTIKIINNHPCSVLLAVIRI